MNLGARWKLRRTTLFSVVCAAMLVGLFVSQYGFYVAHTFWITVLLGVSAWIVRKSTPLFILMAVMAGFFTGMARGYILFEQLKQYADLYGQEVLLVGVVVDDIGKNEARHKQEFHLGSVGYGQEKLIGRIQVDTFDDIMLTRGDRVMVHGVLRSSQGTTRQGVIRAATVKMQTATTSKIEQFRKLFFAAIKKAMPEPHASLGLGYVVGLRVSLPDDLNDQLRAVGLTHIIAVSGYNLTILVQAARQLFAKRSAYQAVVAAGILTVSFVVIAGGSAAINRAAVVCGLSLLAWYYGREFKPLVLLLLSGAITGLYNPLYVWGDPGWYLSFLAFAGILLLSPLITKRYFYTREPRAVVQILLETMCAQVCTIPYAMYLFGAVSIIAPLANLLVLPFIPFIMIGVAAVGVVGLRAPALAAMFSVFPVALLSLQLWIVDHLSRVSWAQREVTISAWIMMALFAMIVLFACSLSRTIRRRERVEIGETNWYNNTSNY